MVVSDETSVSELAKGLLEVVFQLNPADGLSALLSAFVTAAALGSQVATTLEGRKQNQAALVKLLDEAKETLLGIDLSDAAQKKALEHYLGQIKIGVLR